MLRGFKEIRIRSWSNLIDRYKKLDRGDWIFRGHKESNWPLRTSLERALATFALSPSKAPALEGGLLRRFQRQFHHFGVGAPEEDNIMEWLAIMQHYGAPTRLLDWTHSFYAALYFAVEETTKECAVWALDVEWLNKKVREKHRDVWKLVGDNGEDPNVRMSSTYKRVFMSEKRFVIMINPFKLDERLVIQQGAFLCPGDITKPFEKNLTALVADSKARDNFEGKLVKFVVPYNLRLRKKITQELHRMNMNRATLFPGLDGFAKSLTTLLAFPKILTPAKHWLDT